MRLSVPLLLSLNFLILGAIGAPTGHPRGSSGASDDSDPTPKANPGPLPYLPMPPPPVGRLPYLPMPPPPVERLPYLPMPPPPVPRTDHSGSAPSLSSLGSDFRSLNGFQDGNTRHDHHDHPTVNTPNSLSSLGSGFSSLQGFQGGNHHHDDHHPAAHTSPNSLSSVGTDLASLKGLPTGGGNTNHGRPSSSHGPSHVPPPRVNLDHITHPPREVPHDSVLFSKAPGEGPGLGAEFGHGASGWHSNYAARPQAPQPPHRRQTIQPQITAPHLHVPPPPAPHMHLQQGPPRIPGPPFMFGVHPTGPPPPHIAGVHPQANHHTQNLNSLPPPWNFPINHPQRLAPPPPPPPPPPPRRQMSMVPPPPPHRNVPFMHGSDMVVPPNTAPGHYIAPEHAAGVVVHGPTGASARTSLNPKRANTITVIDNHPHPPVHHPYHGGGR